MLWEGANPPFLTTLLDPGPLAAPLDGQLDVSFLLNGFCIAGLPLRRPRDNTLVWKRQDERFALTVQSPEIALPGGTSFVAGLPFGPKARLLAMWLATEAKDGNRRSDDRWIEIGKITDWLRAVGISPEWGPRGSVVATKDQFIRLAFAHFSMVFRREDGFQPFKHETLIEAGVFRDNDLEESLSRKHRRAKMALRLPPLPNGLRPFPQPVGTDPDYTAAPGGPQRHGDRYPDTALLPAAADRGEFDRNHHLAAIDRSVRQPRRTGLPIQRHLYRFD